jgi:hypothetical protein
LAGCECASHSADRAAAKKTRGSFRNAFHETDCEAKTFRQHAPDRQPQFDPPIGAGVDPNFGANFDRNFDPNFGANFGAKEQDLPRQEKLQTGCPQAWAAGD